MAYTHTPHHTRTCTYNLYMIQMANAMYNGLLYLSLCAAYRHQSGGYFTTYSYHSTASASRFHTPTPPLMHATNQPIHFYHSWQPYYEFTNFSPYSIVVAGKRWPTSEHFFQAQKFVGTPLVEKIRICHTPREAFDISRSELGTKWLRKDWSEAKEDVMKLALRAKFTQHQHLHDLLLSTGDRKLVEHTDKDNFWGDGGDGRGQNKLGHMLMELRQELRHKVLRTNFAYPHNPRETTQAPFHDPTPCLTPGRQAASSSQSAQQVHPSQSETHRQASQLMHGNHGAQQGSSYTQQELHQRKPTYVEVLKKQYEPMEWQASGHY